MSRFQTSLATIRRITRHPVAPAAVTVMTTVTIAEITTDLMTEEEVVHTRPDTLHTPVITRVVEALVLATLTVDVTAIKNF